MWRTESQAGENPTIKYMIKLLSSAKAREEEGRFVIEGARLCADAAAGGCAVKRCFTEQAAEKYPDMLARIRACAPKRLSLRARLRLPWGTPAPQGSFVCAAYLTNRPPRLK